MTETENNAENDVPFRYAEQANYWRTTVHPAKSRGEIETMLDDFGATQQVTAKGQVEGGRQAWMIRFGWLGQSYRFVFVPLRCEHPDRITTFGGKRRTHAEQAQYQMGRIAVHFVKAILTAAEAHPHALFGFMELPDTAQGKGLPMTAGELDATAIRSALPPPQQMLKLGYGGIDNEKA